MSHIQDFITAYKAAALWTSTDENEEPMDANYDVTDFSDDTNQSMEADCEKFIQENIDLLEMQGEYSQHGHDFWLTRNRHGAGFWDRCYPKDMSEPLTEASHAFGECDLIAGDDGEIHIM